MLDLSAAPAVQFDLFETRLLAAISATPYPASTSEPTSIQAAKAEPVPARFSIPVSLQLGAGGPKAKFKANVAAIEALKKVEAQGRDATEAERRVMVQYIGWGGLSSAFRHPVTREVAPGWTSEVSQLEGLVSADELDGMRRSTQDSHYTPRVIVDAIYAGLDRLGFRGGCLLDPAFGTGHFLGMAPLAMREASSWVAVELDSLTSSIAESLYPEAKLYAARGFQDVSIPLGHFDVAVGNPPFGATTPFDRKHPDLAGFTLHNFMFGKSLKALRPGGLLAMVVTHRLMDRKHSKERRWLADRADLVAAIRLPHTAFTANAGTSVTTDVLFLRKRLPDEVMSQDWYALGEVTSSDGEAVPVNAYFAANPHMVLGSMVATVGRFGDGETACNPNPDDSLADGLTRAIQHLPIGLYQARPVVECDDGASLPVPDAIPVFGHFVTAAGQIGQRVQDVGDAPRAVLVDLVGRDRDRMVAILGVRDRLRHLLSVEGQTATLDAELDGPRSDLAGAYDKFVKRFGFLNSPVNVNAFRDDADAFRVRALERDYQRYSAEQAAAKGIPVRKGRKSVEMVERADILTRRVMYGHSAPSASTPADALAISLNTTGRVDLERMADMLSLSQDDVIQALGDQLFMTTDGEWQTAEVYLSGNVKAKLASAQRFAESDLRFVRNVEALLAVQPEDVSPADIFIGLGSPWVPGDMFSAFAAEVIGLSTTVTLVSNAQKFVSTGREGGHSRFGTEDMTPAEVFAAALGRESIALYTYHPDGTRTFRPDATDAGRAAAQAIRDEFGEWVWRDEARREQLSWIYNTRFNTDAPRRYDGSHLTFPGKVADDVIELRGTQRDAAWRMIQDGSVLLDHSVGAGKTYTAIAAIMEMKRMGLLRKPMIAVPNHIVGQWATDFIRLYPNANVLAVSEADFARDRRKLLFARIASGEWDAVVVAHSQFSRIRPPVEFENEYLQERLQEITESIAQLMDAGSDRRTVKQAEQRRDQMKERLKERMENIERDEDTACFDDMGIDAIVIDESQAYKNLGFITRKRNVSGLGNPSGSLKAEDLFIKARYLQRTFAGRGVYFLTGTPVSNSLVEFFTVLRFLCYDELADRGIHLFDLWANTFAEETTEFEIDSSGRGLKAKTVLKRFLNLPELMSLYRRVADTVTLADLKRLHLERTGTPWPVPMVLTGKPENVIAPAIPALLSYIENDIIPRMQAVCGERGRKPNPKVDNMLKITSDARLCALDPRLKMPGCADDPGSKVNTALRNILSIHHEWADRRGTQLVFCDLSTPAASVSRERAAIEALLYRADHGDEQAQATVEKLSPDDLLAMQSRFSVYDDLRRKLIAGGVHPDEIAFIHDADTTLRKQALITRVNRGEVRILMGSTSKMGAGTNAQARLVALHHLDAPWRASDLEQREGRIVRQGNLFYEADPAGFYVRIFRYAAERSYDSRMWQLIQRKAAIVEQIRRADPSLREVDDIASDSASAAEMKAAASGNPYLILQVELQAKVKRLETLKRSHVNRVYEADRRLRRLADEGTPDALLAADLARADAAAELMAAHPAEPFGIAVDNVHYDTFKDGANALVLSVIDALNAASRLGGKQHVDIGAFRGADLRLHANAFRPFLVIHHPVAGEIGRASCESDKNNRLSATGLMARVRNAYDDVCSWRDTARRRHAVRVAEIADLTDLAAAPFRQADDLRDAATQFDEVTRQLVSSTQPSVSGRDTVPAPLAAAA